MILAVAALLAATQVPAAGAPLDRGEFRYARPLGAIPRGLVSLVLDADPIARSRELDDVRIADPQGNQVPYVIDAKPAQLVIPLTVPPATREGARSVYRFDLPYETLPRATRLVLVTSARVFERDVTLRRAADEQHGRESRELESQQWSSTNPDTAAPAMTLDCSPHDTRAVEVVIDDGDNAPLPITSARLLLPSFALRFYAPGTPLTLLYGASLPPPHYDLALIAQRVLHQPAREIVLKPSSAKERPESHVERRVFWVAIAVAVLVLLAVLGRLLTIRT